MSCCYFSHKQTNKTNYKFKKNTPKILHNDEMRYLSILLPLQRILVQNIDFPSLHKWEFRLVSPSYSLSVYLSILKQECVFSGRMAILIQHFSCSCSGDLSEWFKECAYYGEGKEVGGKGKKGEKREKERKWEERREKKGRSEKAEK
jgi:hypothetical protein